MLVSALQAQKSKSFCAAFDRKSGHLLSRYGGAVLREVNVVRSLTVLGPWCCAVRSYAVPPPARAPLFSKSGRFP
jgi:hypothetical protein